MNVCKKILCDALLVTMTAVSAFAAGVDKLPEGVNTFIPEKIHVLIADVGTIDSVSATDKWLGEQLQPKQNLDSLPVLEAGAMSVDPNLRAEHFRWNMHTRQMEYSRQSRQIQEENAELIRLLRNLRTRTISDANQRNVILCKDFIQASLGRKYRRFFNIVDRGNVDMGIVEKELQGKGDGVMASATCIVTVVMGDLETDSRTIPVNSKGTLIKRTTYRQPYTGKLRDLEGNVLLAFDGQAESTFSQNSVIKAENANPTRQLMQNACAKIADELAGYFLTELKFAVKGPKGDQEFDADDVFLKIDGKPADFDNKVFVLAAEHEIEASTEGYQTIRKVISTKDNDGESQTVKLNFKK